MAGLWHELDRLLMAGQSRSCSAASRARSDSKLSSAAERSLDRIISTSPLPNAKLDLSTHSSSSRTLTGTKSAEPVRPAYQAAVSVGVVFEQVADGNVHHVCRRLDLDRCDVARSPK